MKKVYGDLIEMAEHGDFDVIVHGCNCFCTMGAGIALQIKHHFPEAYYADCDYSKKGDKKNLGFFSNINKICLQITKVDVLSKRIMKVDVLSQGT